MTSPSARRTPVAKTQRIRAEIMHMRVARAAVRLELEMVVLNIREAVAHLGLAGADGLRPDDFPRALDLTSPGHGGKFRRDDQFRPERAGAHFRSREVQVIFLFEHVVGKFIAQRQAHAPRPPVRPDNVAARDFRLLAAVLGVGRHEQRFAMRAQNRPIALVKPFRRGADCPRRGLALFDSKLKHFHAVRRRL